MQLRKEVVIPLQISEEKGEHSRQNIYVKCAIAKTNYEEKKQLNLSLKLTLRERKRAAGHFGIVESTIPNC